MEINGLGARLRQYRLKKGLSLQELADAAKSSKAHIYELETNRTKNPSLGLLTELSRVLGVPIKDLVGESSFVADGEPQELAPLFRELRGLNPDALKLVRALTDELRKQAPRDDKKADD
jgi:transcriptional regulator with XRE-family HTH domain